LRPIDPKSQQYIDAQSLTYRAPYFDLAFPIGISPLPSVSTEVIPRVQSYFMQNRVSFNVAVSLALVVSF
jgi:hypothetical protein